ncbi:MAG: matrixin family metalloprotease [Xanthobacteraceae bacterium]|nr:matrixin family metalloprotease [Xanthobacteraceae bacterium]
MAILAAGLAVACRGAAASEQSLLLRLDGAYVKWGSARLGTPAQVRYTLISGPMQFPGAINCASMVPLGPLLKASRIERESFRQEVAAAFGLWEAAAGIQFVETADTGTADILIGAQATPRGFAFTNVDHERAGLTPVSSTAAQVQRIQRSLICLNPTKLWKIGFDGNLDVYDIRYTIAHEVGHAIGLDHPSPSGELMSFRYTEDFRALQPGDVAGAVALYGEAGVASAEASSKSSAGAGSAIALH